MKTYVDPPQGYLYGFPKEFTWVKGSGETIEEWFLNEGYSEYLINKGYLRHVRMWTE